jgi:osmotically inducible protein OsmC
MKRKASAVWKGGIMDGKGTISTDSGVLADTQYSYSTRFEEGKGTNPEELIAAAHAGCFSMALSGQLGKAGAGKVVCVVSGGNIDARKLARILDGEIP